ncbi:MAG: tRNA (uridine(34)/cytosine(34)/5-carboxymethylaminomethyluridine(34)-2'-O)-methyltransferase TrmL [Oscillospiraceae bacterium]|nr:tRNA (uridine(34)/cytosine(34)/5-carboxymethylaminomethyluridine(34)-2'-O)-methyltransferase TrmL [Oscillospiraceae bacterium]
MLNIVLVEPEIPHNTGNIARTCSCTDVKLHLIKPLGFSLDEKQLKRAGLDYWDKLDLEIHEDIKSFFEKYGEDNIFLVETGEYKKYTDVDYTNHESIFLLFGQETKGLPKELLEKHRDKCIKIPMASNIRSLNLSNSVAIVTYEVLRQLNFNNLE